MAFFPVTLIAGEIINQQSRITIDMPYYDAATYDSTQLLIISRFDISTGEKTSLGTIDLLKYHLLDTQYMTLFATDWKRDRLIIGSLHKVIVPDYHIVSLKTLELRPLENDSIRNTVGEFYITPECKYIIVFGQDYTRDIDFRDSPNILYTCLFDADTYKPISAIRGISIIGVATTPLYFIPPGDSLIYITNPMSYRSNNSIIKLSLPDLKILDTLIMADYCSPKPNYSFAYDAQSNNVLFYIKCDSIHSQYKYVNAHTKSIIGELIEDNPHACEYGRISDDEKYIALHSGDKITMYDSTLTKLYQIDNVGFNSLRWAYFKDGELVANSKEEGILNKYDVATGALLERIQIHEVQH